MTSDAAPPTRSGWRRWWRHWIDLPLKGDQRAARESIEALVPIRNERLWFLITSAVIASVGLNTDSAAIVIGGMLISPLMGPIVGLGYALAVRDRLFARRSSKHLGIAILVSLLVSTAYFAASPLHERTHEIVARTRPNLLDLVVALAAAAAGVIALAHAELSATLPGVAIATAIMPPLCVAGFGVARGDTALALGALYLFVVNAVAIALCAFVLFRRMHFSTVAVESGSAMSRWLAAGLIAALLFPLTSSLYVEARNRRQSDIAEKFVHETARSHRVAASNFSAGKRPELTLFLLDQPGAGERARLSKAFAERLANATLRIQATVPSTEVRQALESLRASAIDSSTAIRRVQAALEESKRQAEVKTSAAPPSGAEERWSATASDWRALEPRLEDAVLFPTPMGKEPLLVIARLKTPTTSTGLRRLVGKWEPWLADRLERPVRLLFAP